MTLDTTVNRVIFAGNGATTIFTYAFNIPDADSVVAIYTDADGVETTLSSSQYQITGLNDNAGGTLTYPLSGPAIAVGTTLTLQRIVALVQQTELVNQGGYYPAVVEDQFDYLTMIDQQQQDAIERSLTASPTDPAGLSYVLPSVAQRAEAFLYFDVDGNVTTAAGAVGGGVVVSTPMEPVVGAATVADALDQLGGVSNTGGSIAGDFDISGNVDIGGSLTVDGQELTNTFPFGATRQWGSISNGTYLLAVMPFAFTALVVKYNVGTGGGSFTANVKISATSITGASAIAVSSSTTATATCTAANTGAQYAEVYVTISATTGSPVNAWLSVQGTRTV
jgi:hypothetical protein